MKNTKLYKWEVSIFIIILLLSLTACGQIFKRPQENSEGESKKQEKKEPPEVLTKMQADTEKIISDIQKVKDERAKMARQKDDAEKSENEKPKESQQQASKEEEKKQDSSSEGQKGGKEEKDKEKGQSEKQGEQQPQVKWPEFEKIVEEFHSLWNEYEVQAKEDGVSAELLTGFEDQLNALTEQIMAHNEDKTLVAANSLYQHYPKFLNYYKHNAPPETEEMKYYIEEILILAQQEKWEEANPFMNDLEKAWLICKARMEKQDKQTNAKIDAAVEDLKKVLPMKNLSILKLKAAILKNNINDIK